MTGQRSQQWLSAQEALEHANFSICDEWQSMQRLRDLAKTGEIESRGVIDGKVTTLDQKFWTNWRTEEGQWGAHEDWLNGRFEGRILTLEGRRISKIAGASNVEFSSADLFCHFPEAPKRSRRKSGRPQKGWWPTLAEELAVILHLEGRPETIEALMSKVLNRLAERGIDPLPGRSTIQETIRNVFNRLDH